MDRGETRQIDKGFGEFEDWRDHFLRSRKRLERHKLNRKIVREQHWVVHGVSGRRKRNVRRLQASWQDLRDQREKSASGQRPCVSFTAAEAGTQSGKTCD